MGEPVSGLGISSTMKVLGEVENERARQEAKWGEQNHPDGTGVLGNETELADLCKKATDEAFEAGRGTWKHILREEYAEAMAESDPARLREELVQVAAVAVAWIEAIDRRQE